MEKHFIVRTTNNKNKIHLGNNKNILLCGSKLDNHFLSKIEITIICRELKIRLPDNIYNKNWVTKRWINVGESFYCKKCLDKLQKLWNYKK